MKNLRNQSIFTCLFLLVLISLRAEAMPPPSPAGGNYLVLDGVDDHAILDFEIFGLLIPKDADEFTFEAWVYPTTLPNTDVHTLVLSQQVMMDVTGHDHQGFGGVKVLLNLSKGDFMIQGLAHLARDVGHTIMSLAPMKFPANQWNHIAFQGGKGRKTTVIVNDFARISGGEKGITLAHDADKITSLGGHPQDFTLGGCETKKIPFHTLHSWGYFAGYIDEVRISKVIRYNTAKRGFTPQRKFKNDAKTVALWHFDEPSGARAFSDTSGNAYHLMGRNGAETGGTLAVEAEGKLATIWGRLKR
ncbi:hypothetical protein C6503_06685 [Candidatus Poribacteria bacterium]|nr:MAG: hypothetical protein C6503_06685 [Candidatus Poribacteria bacterium]